MKILKNPGFTLRYNAWLREVDRIRGDVDRESAIKLLFINNPDKDWRSLFKWIECYEFAHKYMDEQNKKREKALNEMVQLNQEMGLY